MSEKLFEELITKIPKSKQADEWILETFKKSKKLCSVENFAIFYFNLIKSQTDDFIKNNTSTCNTPRKNTISGTIENNPDLIFQDVMFERNVIEKSNPNRSKIGDVSNNESQKNKKQSSRELFCNNQMSNSFTKRRKSRQQESPSNHFEGNQCLDSSTPRSTSLSKSANRFNDCTPINTSTPQSSRNSKHALSLIDNSSTHLNNSSKNSLDLSSRNNSTNRRNTSSSSLCFGDFFNASTVSNSGKGNKKKLNDSQSSQEQTPKFSQCDFPSLGSESQQEVKVSIKEKEKPKKRVVPMTVSSKSPGGSTTFISSSFQSENNLLNVMTVELEKDGNLFNDRNLLRSQRDEITKDFNNIDVTPQKNLHSIVRESLASVSNTPKSLRKASFQYDEIKVERPDLLSSMAKLYSFLLDLNLLPNILNEFSYLFNLLNIEQEPSEQRNVQSQSLSFTDITISLLKKLDNCIYFTSCVLNYQKQTIALLDVMTIRVLIENEKIRMITKELYEFLRIILQRKSQLDISTTQKLNKQSGNNFNQVVFYQHETDNRDNFPSEKEFSAFKKQRDMFYSILRTWELMHLNSNWDFKKNLGLKIRSLIILMEHPINMAHLAKLFTAQLIISCNFDNSANELQMVLPNIDLGKLSKLRQRLVAPSVFSTQYLFPGNQAFFRDFINCCDQHMMFMEQLKVSLISELMELNDSSMDAVSITANDERNDSLNGEDEFIVRPETMTTMRILAKFVGFLVSRPYTFDGYRNVLVDQKQLQVRNLLHPDFDVKQIVLKSMNGHKLLVTIPWLVEYLAMLDFITIRLEYYRETFQILYSIYLRVNTMIDSNSLCKLPTSRFIIRICLGWLFDHPEIPQEYFLVENQKQSTLGRLQMNEKSSTTSKIDNIDHLNPHLEAILNVACPFLADFRVSMMPQRITRAVSRTGRYRHITTKIQEKSFVEKTKSQDNRERLIEAFLGSQTLSMKKIIEFTIDRVTSAVVKDFQVKCLIGMKKAARLEAEKLVQSSQNHDVLMKKMIEVYQQHLKMLQDLWMEETKKNCVTRTQGVLNALLPIEVLDDVKTTLFNITLERTSEKIEDWRSTNIKSIEIFSKDIQADATKMMENHQSNVNGNTRTMSNVVIDISAKTMPAEFFEILQTLLHKTSRHPEKVDFNDILQCVEAASDVLDKQILPINAYRNIGFYILQLVLLLIVNRCEFVTKELLGKIYILWRHEKLMTFTNLKFQQTLGKQNHMKCKVENFIFSNVISSSFLVTMQMKNRRNFQCYAEFLVDLVKEKFITTEIINEQSIQLYKHEWTQQSLHDIAFFIDYIKSSLPASSSAESQLFMELVVDLARDMEKF
ncbi:CLUMA_CG010826, isoform A [Clunio marinus]|uniref:CLUMA_CG010826, isoform A n=1 Tax=Clunio marinus TaxID=568069 RepID=A0A1J1IAX4_9DIPT|nr:CLUMA_CG010826, isoform A [Clunio marinus]